MVTESIFKRFSITSIFYFDCSWKMKPMPINDEEMRRFSEGKIILMVTTTVIEVGVNVPKRFCYGN